MEDIPLLETQKTALEALEKLADDIRSGRVIEFIGVGMHANGRDYHILGGNTENRHAMAGILMELAMERLNFKVDDDARG
jgi:hypothetical protein